MSRESDYIDFLIQEYKILLQNKGFIEVNHCGRESSEGLFYYAKGRAIQGYTHHKRFEQSHKYIYLHISIVNQVVAWFWRDSKLWPDGSDRFGNRDSYFSGEPVTKLDSGIRGGTPELLRHFLSKPSEEWLVKEEK